MSRLESKCEDLVCYDCPFKGAKIICNLAHNSDSSLNEVLESVKEDLNKVEKRLSREEDKEEE